MGAGVDNEVQWYFPFGHGFSRRKLTGKCESGTFSGGMGRPLDVGVCGLRGWNARLRLRLGFIFLDETCGEEWIKEKFVCLFIYFSKNWHCLNCI